MLYIVRVLIVLVPLLLLWGPSIYYYKNNSKGTCSLKTLLILLITQLVMVAGLALTVDYLGLLNLLGYILLFIVTASIVGVLYLKRKVNVKFNHTSASTGE